jgi:hypothetical protein
MEWYITTLQTHKWHHRVHHNKIRSGPKKLTSWFKNVRIQSAIIHLRRIINTYHQCSINEHKSLNRNLSFNRKNRKIEILLIVVRATIRTVMLDQIHLKPANSQLSWIMEETQTTENIKSRLWKTYRLLTRIQVRNLPFYKTLLFQLYQMSEDSILTIDAVPSKQNYLIFIILKMCFVITVYQARCLVRLKLKLKIQMGLQIFQHL